MYDVMTQENDRWEDFLERLSDKMENVGCGGGIDKTHSRDVLKDMGLSEQEIELTCGYLEQQGGCCDCEIFLNVDMPLSWFDEDEDERQ